MPSLYLNLAAHNTEIFTSIGLKRFEYGFVKFQTSPLVESLIIWHMKHYWVMAKVNLKETPLK
jgi:hypothetical protein